MQKPYRQLHISVVLHFWRCLFLLGTDYPIEVVLLEIVIYLSILLPILLWCVGKYLCMSQEIAVVLLGSEYQYAVNWGYALTNALHESSMVLPPCRIIGQLCISRQTLTFNISQENTKCL
jgi:hypothetical protein